jgi:UDP-N-acetylglucosamine 2-epimerase
MRDETEWTETVTLGWNMLVGASSERIIGAFEAAKQGKRGVEPYGDGHAAGKIIEVILSH